jgi:hypothetical protein
MCTITLTYDNSNVQAREKLEALIASGMFIIEKDESNKDAEALEKFMQQARTRIPQRNMSLEEAYDVVMGELEPLYTN